MSFQSAKELLSRGELDAAESTFLALTNDPQSRAEACYGVGFVRYTAGDHKAAAEWFQQCLTAEPNHQNALFYLADLHERSGDRDRAVQLFARVLMINPRHASALERLTNAGRPVPAAAQQPRPPVAPQSPDGGASNAKPPRSPSSPNSAVGIAQHVRLQPVPWRGKPAAQQSLTLRVELRDRNGNPAGILGLELRGHEIRGTVENGDWVEILQPPPAGGSQIKSLRNLTTGEAVTAKNRWFMAQ
jgi:tetratricopeptide (TPR) repeat protein